MTVLDHCQIDVASRWNTGGARRASLAAEKKNALAQEETKRAKLESRRSNRSLLTRFPIANYASSTTNNKQRRCYAPLILVTSYLSSTREYFVISMLCNCSLSISRSPYLVFFFCLCRIVAKRDVRSAEYVTASERRYAMERIYRIIVL